MAKITPVEVQDMVRHWLTTPVNGYLGSGYGSNLRDMLMAPMAAGEGDKFVAKLVRDVPVLQAAAPGQINAYITDEIPDRRRVLIEVGGDIIVGDPNQRRAFREDGDSGAASAV